MENEIRDYDFDIIEMIKAGWERINGVKAQFVAGFAVYIAAAIIVQLLLGLVFPQGTTEAPNLLNRQIVGILSYPVLMPIMAGVMMMAIKHSRGEAVDFRSVFDYFYMTGKLALAGVIIYVFTIIGIMLLVLPGIYVSVAYAFTIPLIVDKNMDVWEAMELSRKTVTKHWFKVAGLMGLLSIIMFLGAIPLGAGLVWTVPLMFVTLYGLAYPVMFEGEA
jgi:membrane-anchored glycerophosphoryl diester phosphodiesterase (GDPDase)